MNMKYFKLFLHSAVHCVFRNTSFYMDDLDKMFYFYSFIKDNFKNIRALYCQ